MSTRIPLGSILTTFRGANVTLSVELEGSVVLLKVHVRGRELEVPLSAALAHGFSRMLERGALIVDGQGQMPMDFRSRREGSN